MSSLPPPRERINHEAFRSECHALILAGQQSIRSGDYRGVLLRLGELEALRPDLEDEPATITWEWAYIISKLNAASFRADLNEFDAAAALAREAKLLMDQRDVRRTALGLDLLPQSREKLGLYLISAELLRRAPDQFAHHLHSAEQLLELARAFTPFFKQRLIDYGLSKQYQADELEVLGWFSLHLLCAVERRAPELTPAALDVLFEATGLVFPRVPDGEPSTHLLQNHWYWRWRGDYMAMNGLLDEGEAARCFAEIRRTAHIYLGRDRYEDPQYLRAIEYEHLRLREINRAARLARPPSG